MIQTTAGLSAALATLNFSINLAAYLRARSSTRLSLPAGIFSRTRAASFRSSPAVLTAGPSSSSLLALGALLSDFRKTLRLTGLIPLCIRLKSWTSNDASRGADPVLRRVVLLQCGAYIVFQAMENIYHLHVKGIFPSSIVDNTGGIAKWIAWSCRAWAIAIASDFLRLWREVRIVKHESGTKTADEEENFKNRWWKEFMASAFWLPVAVHSSFYPKGSRYMNAGTVALLSLLAASNNCRNQWQAAA